MNFPTTVKYLSNFYTRLDLLQLSPTSIKSNNFKSIWFSSDRTSGLSYNLPNFMPQKQTSTTIIFNYTFNFFKLITIFDKRNSLNGLKFDIRLIFELFIKLSFNKHFEGV